MKLLMAVFITSGTAAFAGPIAFNFVPFFELRFVPFDGLQNGEQVLSFYDGGFGGQGSGPGPLIGVTFTDGLAADPTAIVSGPSARLTATSVTMNLDDPWVGLISFYYIGTGVVSFYSGPDGNGTLVESHVLSFPTVYPFGALPAAFQSVVFESDAGLQLDRITFGGQVIPEPSGLTLLSLGIVFVAGMRHLLS